MEETITLLKTTRPTFYRWLRAGKLRGTKVGRQWRFTNDDVDRFLKGHEAQIDLPADIHPLITILESKLKALKLPAPAPKDASPTTRAVDLMMQLAAAMHASDIHIDAQQTGATFRLRIDGVLYLLATFDLRLLPPLIERWKSLAAMDVREKAMPQDGRILFNHNDASIDLRVCIVPAYLGESLTARMLSSKDVLLDLDRLSLNPADRQRLDKALALPWGMIVVVGPTGSGKTTTLYSCLGKVTDDHRKVVSIEDPVEYILPGVTQIRVNHKIGLSFEHILRAVFRIDPDVIMLGEVQNASALQLAMQATVIGHLLLTTLHVEESAAALRRMLDLGVQPFLITDAVKLIVAQRLVRKLCPKCSVAYTPPRDQLARAHKLAAAGGIPSDALPKKYRRPVGCPACGNLGFRGRAAVYESLEISPELAEAIRTNRPLPDLRNLAVKQGMTTLAAAAIQKSAEGQTSLPEALSLVANINY
jgi:excisionase family DNA binding protein